MTSKMDYDKYNNEPLVKPEQNSADSCSSSSQSSREQQQPQPNFREWINEFNKECVKICGTRCSEKLDEIMEEYIQEIKKELILCDSSPNIASLIANRMSKTMMLFYLYYSDIKEFFVISQWNENISLLLLFYCRLELKAAHRVHRGKDSDSLVCSRIMNALWIYLNYNYESMIHVVLQLPQIGRRHKDILDPIFRKLLLNKKQKPLTEMEYIRNLLAFKLWKRLYDKEDKKSISHLALTELRPPRSFVANYKKYKFLPAWPNNIDIHTQFVTGLIDVDSAIKEYLEVFHKNKRSDYHPTEKKSFISEFCSSFEGLDNTSDDLSDTYMLDKIKNENDIEEIEDDDCIIVDDSTTPPPPIGPRLVPPDPTEVIDLKADEPEPQINLTETDDVVSLWCKELIKQPPPPVLENPVEMTEESKMENMSRKEVIILTNEIVTPVKELRETITPTKDIISPKREIITSRIEISPPKTPPPVPPVPSLSNITSNVLVQAIPVPILPVEVPYWHEIEESQQKLDSSSQLSGTNLLVNINLDNCNTDHEIQLPIKKRRVSILKVEIKDELSYSSAPMLSIAELDSIKLSNTVTYLKLEQLYSQKGGMKDDAASVANNASIHSETSRKFKLPLIELKKFDGDIRKWLPFWSKFQEIHTDEAIPLEDKFQYLVQTTVVGSRARAVVESFPPTRENYQKAIESLQARFGRDELLVEVYVRKLLKMVLQNKMFKGKYELTSLYDKLETQLRALESHGVTSDKCAAMLFPLVESCLPEDLLRTWQRSSNVADENEDTDKLQKVMKFLKKEVESEERIALAREGVGFSSVENKIRR